MATLALALIKRKLMLWIVASPRDLLYKVNKWTDFGQTITLILSRCGVGNHQTMLDLLETIMREDVLHDALCQYCISAPVVIFIRQFHKAHGNNNCKICIHISQGDVPVHLEQRW